MQQSQMMQHPGTQNTCDPDVQAYGIRTLRIFGGIQIGIGILCGILSLVGVVIYGIDKNKHCSYTSYYDYDYYQHYSNYRNCRQFKGIAGRLFDFNMTCLIFSGWNLLTGMYPFFMNQRRRSSCRCLKITFMVCSIVGASVFMPIVVMLEVSEAVILDALDIKLFALPAFRAVLSLIEMVVAIAAASYCCCSSFGITYQPVTVYITTNQEGMILEMSQTQIPNGQIQVPVAPPVTIAQAGRQPIGATAQQYLVPGTYNNVMYQVPTIQDPVQATIHQMQAEESHPPPDKE